VIDRSSSEDRGEFSCPPQVPFHLGRVVGVAQSEPFRQSGSVGFQPDDEEAAALQSGFVPRYLTGFLDNAGEDEVLDAGTAIVNDKVAQVRYFQFMIEAVVFGWWPCTADVVEVDYSVMVRTFCLQRA